ncbi:hypothetical protein ACJX0J_040185, partial [Zea mays]
YIVYSLLWMMRRSIQQWEEEEAAEKEESSRIRVDPLGHRILHRIVMTTGKTVARLLGQFLKRNMHSSLIFGKLPGT